MREHLSPQIVTRFHEQALEPSDSRSIYDHIKGCDPCRSLIVDERVEATALRALMEHLLPDVADEPYHLEFELIEGYVDHTLSAVDRSTTEMHLEVCGACAEDVKDLETSLRTMQTHAMERRPNEFASLFTNGLLNLGLWFGPPQIALATGIILLASAGVVIWRLNSKTQPKPNQPIVVRQSTPLPGEPSPPRTMPSPSPLKNNETPVTNGEDRFANRGRNLEDGEARVALVDGPRKVTLRRSGTILGLADLPAETQQQVKAVLLAQAIIKPDVISELRSDQSISRGTSSDDQTIRPIVPAAVISEDRPVFKWAPLKDATSYRVVVGDPNFQPIARSDQLLPNTTEWTPPTPLPRGVVYTWMVKATRSETEGSPVSSPPMKFKVLEAERLTELASLRKASPSRLALGVFYARAGMIAEAEQEFQILLRENPNSRLARKLLREVNSWH